MGERARLSSDYMVVRIWHGGRVEDVAGPVQRQQALAIARRVATEEGAVYLRAPDDRPMSRPPALFGEIPGVVPGQRFRRRIDLARAGVHRNPQTGIDWTSEGAVAVAFSGGYADDVWSEQDPWYTGEGGQDVPGGRQVRDQEPVRGNRALLANLRDGLPVRVIRRRAAPGGDYEFVYEGLYHVVDYTYAPGRDGPKVYRFQLRQSASDEMP